METETRIMEVLPKEGFPTTSFKQTAIPWCTTHHSKQLGFNPELCEFAAWYSNQAEHQIDGQHCTISQGGPDHKWWKDT